MTARADQKTARTAVLYTRVSSREQEQEGFSLDAQSKLLRDYASRHGIPVDRAFEDVETARVTGRKQFAAMVDYMTRNRTCKIVIVEKVDRLYRNFRDALTLEDLDAEIHFVKEGEILTRDSKSQAKLSHDLRLAIARNYSENLKEEVKKGMHEKAAQGTYPARAPIGYKNNQVTGKIDVHPENAEIVHFIFAQYATGDHSVDTLRKAVHARFGKKFARSYVHKILTNRFYIYRSVRVGFQDVQRGAPTADRLRPFQSRSRTAARSQQR